MAEVVLVRWPEEGPEGARLACEGIPVLYVVGADDDPPAPATCLEDWVRLPGDDRDLAARVAALELRAFAHDAQPTVDDRGRFHYRGRLLALPPAEAPLARVLAEHFGDVVSDRDLCTATSVEVSSLRIQVAQLRSRLRAHGLSVRRIRGRGYRLQR